MHTRFESHIGLGSLLICKAARLNLVILVQELQLLLYGWEETILWWLYTKKFQSRK